MFYHNKVQEDYLKLVIAENTSGSNLSEVTLRQLDDSDFNMKYLRGQGYDGGGANILGQRQGVVQVQILKTQHFVLLTRRLNFLETNILFISLIIAIIVCSIFSLYFIGA